MRRPPMTQKVKRGLATLVELGRSWREADEDYRDDGTANGTLDEKERDECDAAMRWVENGGLS